MTEKDVLLCYLMVVDTEDEYNQKGDLTVAKKIATYLDGTGYDLKDDSTKNLVQILFDYEAFTKEQVVYEDNPSKNK